MKLTQANTPQGQDCEAWNDSPFKMLSAPQLELLHQSTTTLHFGRHQTIFAAQTKPLGVYCIKKGTVKLTSKGTQPDIQPILHIAKRGEVLGIDDVVSDSLYHYNAETLEDVEVCLIEKETFLSLIRANSALAQELLMRASVSLRERDSSICRLSRYNVRERTAQTLLSLTSEHGRKIRGGIRLDLQLTRKEIAQLTGTVQESVVRILSDFKKDGLIGMHKREITILDQEGLTKVYDPARAGSAV